MVTEAVPMEKIENIEVQEFIVDLSKYGRVRRYEYLRGEVEWRGHSDFGNGWVILTDDTQDRLEKTYQEDIE